MDEISEKIPAVHANAADNQDVTYIFGIERVKTTSPIKNTTGSGPNSTGQEPTNNDKQKFDQLQQEFLSEVSYNKGHGTICGIQSNHWRIDQQENMADKHNIQYQVGEKNFANVVVNTVIKPNPKPDPKKPPINMGMKVFAQRQGMKKDSARTVSRVYDVYELDQHRKDDSKIKLDEKINKYVGEALRESLYQKVKYEINVILLVQKLG